MADLTSIEKFKLEKLFEMEGGYVLNFSNRTFEEFFLENFNINIFNHKYDYASGSKANRLRAFWIKEDNSTVGKLLQSFLKLWKLQRDLNNQIITLAENGLYEECCRIAERLMSGAQNSFHTQEAEESRRKKQEASKEHQLSLLLKMFDEMAMSNEYQKRGFLLQDLLNRLFLIHEIPVTKSFQRNDGGEQIDGAFFFYGWHYIVECKWTKKLADVRELDSLLGKVNRSGRQSMGLFLSIEGWSVNVPPLLKQNPSKCILLMEGYDLRSVLSGQVELERLLQSKITKLNLESEPFFSATELTGK